MAYIITSECVKCGVCLDICPTSAIIESEEQFMITDACVDCGKCEEVCPIDAIKNVKMNGQ
ncbi:MAG: 4Fe-4S binding protein [Candidatus Tenebribacter mawsonii]|jgi:formate hydrogenlyase subunit 6/NADH:ubiquinone oxidoreductase subunit I|nr:4Fe-4S binding protein [Candidatus Tenebribacter mawsonii]